MALGTHQQTNRIGKRGAWIVPANLRQRYGLEEGALVIAEARPEGILLRPAIASPVLSASTIGEGNPWSEWFDLMKQVKATSQEIEDARKDGRR